MLPASTTRKSLRFPLRGLRPAKPGHYGPPRDVRMRLRGQDRGAPDAPYEGGCRNTYMGPPDPLRRGFEALREQGYKLVGDVAAELGVSATTLRRMEEEGVIPEAKLRC